MDNILSFQKLIDAHISEGYFNTLIASVNDHVVKLSIMSEPYPWHSHPNSDETFIGIEGTVVIETPEKTFELTPGTSITIPRNQLHRTSPKGQHSVNLTIESKDIKTLTFNLPVTESR